MAGIENVRVSGQPTTLELTLDEENEKAERAQPVKPKDELDSDANRKTLRRLLDWYFQERERQAVNRYQMAIDHDFYDGLQWDQEDAEEVMSRGQAPLVYNEVAPMADWMIGTERRTRVDWSVMPRTEDDVEGADLKTKTMKYVSDINRAAFHRSRAFADAVKGGIGWVEDGARNDPSKDILFSRYEDWRYVLWDSSAMELDVDDGRYMFRWRWADLDVAEALFPKRRAALRRAAVAANQNGEEDDEFWYLGQNFQARDSQGNAIGRRTYVADTFIVGNRRERVKLIEGWYRMPVTCQRCVGEVFDGEIYDPKHPMMRHAAESGAIGLVDQVMMRMHTAIFTEKDLLHVGLSPYRHNRYPLTPIWCYRRGRDRMPYGAIRRVRDVQEDLNKRASKSLFVLSTNQLIAEKGSFDDWEEAREEADRPDGVLIHNKGTKIELRRDTDMARGHLEWMNLDAVKIQNTAGINNENLGRQTNAASGEAIKARQLQGSVVTTEPFDNLRYAVQVQGEKVLSNIEQFYSEPKVLRIAGNRGQIEWVKINQPEVQPDGSVRWLNDITARQADFVVSEQDFHGTMRQAMFETMMGMVSRAGIAPELALRLLRMAFDFSDFPNKDEIVAEIRKISGEPDPNKKLTPEEAQAQAAMRAQQEAMQQQQMQAAKLALEEQAAKVRKLNAEAEAAMAKIQQIQSGADGIAAQQQEDAIRAVQAEAAARIDEMARKLVEAQAEAANRKAEYQSRADSEAQVARIQADAAVRVADIERESSAAMDALLKRMDDLTKALGEQIKGVEDSVAKRLEAAAKDAKKEPAPAPAPAPAAAPNATIVFEKGAIQVDAGSKAVAKTVTGTDGKGNKITLTVAPKVAGSEDGDSRDEK